MSEAGGIRIRAAGPEDLAAVARIENLSFSDPWSAGALVGELVNDALRLPLIAEKGGCLVGYLMAWRVVDQLHVLNIAVDPVLRQGGVGSALLAAAARIGAADGLTEFTLEVRTGNTAAVTFYRRHGFVQAGVRKGYYADTGEDALILNCPLANWTDD